MLVERLQARCPSAKLLGVGEARGYELKFSKKSKDGSGKAMPFETGQSNTSIHGVLFEIAKADLGELDKAEGKGYGYDRVNDFTVVMGEQATARDVTTYIANADYIDTGLQPFDWYLALVLAGAHQQALPAEYIETLRKVTCVRETKLKRPTRMDALKALRAAGVDDVHKLFFIIYSLPHSVIPAQAGIQASLLIRTTNFVVTELSAISFSNLTTVICRYPLGFPPTRE